MVTVERTAFRGWDDCVRVADGTVEVIATTEIGPRVVYAGRVDADRNELFLVDDDAGATGGDDYRFYGGHRLWYGPEDPEYTLIPDNDPVDVEELADGVALRQPREEKTGLRKRLEVRLSGTGDAHPAVTGTVELRHEIENEGEEPFECAPWPITMLDGAGTAVVPVDGGAAETEDEGEDRLPDRSIVLWPYTDPADDRLSFEDEHVLLDRSGGEGECKVGATVPREWAAFVREDTVFAKRVAYDPTASYPDRGCSVEAYSNGEMLELETLGPLRSVAPGESVSHGETWVLGDVPADPEGPAAVAEALLD